MTKLFYRGPAMDLLHEKYAKRGRVDTRAPVQVSEQAMIAAPVESVWALLSDPSRWPAVDPAIKDVCLDAPLIADAKFTWTNGKARIRSQVAVINPGREITWTGTSSGSRAVHRYVLEPTEDGTTLLRSDESMAGLLLPLFFSSKKASNVQTKWLAALKRAAEHGDGAGV